MQQYGVKPRKGIMKAVDPSKSGLKEQSANWKSDNATQNPDQIKNLEKQYKPEWLNPERKSDFKDLEGVFNNQ